MKHMASRILLFCCLLLSTAAFADKTLVVHMHLLTGAEAGKSIGVITVMNTQKGLVFFPDLHGLPPGKHGFHVHENASCSDKGQAAGGHLDPELTGKHLGPYKKGGHIGDLPVLDVNQNGNALIPVLAPNLTLQDIKNHALMIHAGGDNYSDKPEKLGGGGARLACGVAY